MIKQPCVYMLASHRNGTIYIGVTSDLIKRASQHRQTETKGFSHEYRIKRLVWHETHPTMESAIAREKALKKWRREWKLHLIEKNNPHWNDLYPTIL